MVDGVTKDFKKRLLKDISTNPVSISELSRKLKVRRDFVTGYLQALEDMGDIRLVVVGRSKVYLSRK